MKGKSGESPPPRGWRSEPPAARVFVAVVIAAGISAFALSFPLLYPRPWLFAAILVAACLTSVWKVSLPTSVACGSTLSVSYASNMMALLLLGPRYAVPIAVAGVWTQCTWRVKEPYPLYRTVFSAAAEAITMSATGAAYVGLGGRVPPVELAALPKPLVGAIATYFFFNTGLVAFAIAASTRRPFWKVWHDDFLWSGASFMVAGTAGAAAALLVERGSIWIATLMLAPVYLTYWTYRVFIARLEDQRRHEEARNELLARERSARESAEQANRLKDQFLATVSHELRTPLNAILGWAEMLQSGMLDQSRRERAMHAIYDGAKRQAKLIDELLDVARIMSGKLLLERATVDVQEVLSAAIALVQPVADKKRIEIRVDVESSIGTIYADGARLQQIIWNLLTNAVKFTPEGGAIHLAGRRSGAAIEFAVSDTGPGIPPEFLPSLFEPFRQADASTTRPHGGLGLGLSIVRHLVEAHGGSVTAESAGDGSGCTFTVRLPVARARDGEQRSDSRGDGGAAGDHLEAAPPSLEGISVLVVDDDDESRHVVAAYLEGQKATVLTAASTEQALGIMQSERVDVLLADVAMPGQDGYTLIRKLRALGSPTTASVPAAALTAFAREEDRRQALQAGFHLHLTKPIDAHSLISAVASLRKVNPT